MAERGDPDYEGSIWEYVDAVIDNRERTYL